MNPADNYILKQEEQYQSILLFVRQVIFETLPEINERFKYGIPFYYYKQTPFCYLNIPKNKKYVDIGFVKGFQLSNKQGVLVAGNNRNTVKSIQYHALEDVDTIILKEILIEAGDLIS
ncbi:MAG: DUF1801 domain-containing protein [Bacteroidota bacterium]